MTTFDKELDTSGLTCPMPVMKCKKFLQMLTTGQVLHLMATDPGTKSDIPALVGITGDQIIKTSEEGGTVHFFIKKAQQKRGNCCRTAIRETIFLECFFDRGFSICVGLPGFVGFVWWGQRILAAKKWESVSASGCKSANETEVYTTIRAGDLCVCARRSVSCTVSNWHGLRSSLAECYRLAAKS